MGRKLIHMDGNTTFSILRPSLRISQKLTLSIRCIFISRLRKENKLWTPTQVNRLGTFFIYMILWLVLSIWQSKYLYINAVNLAVTIQTHMLTLPVCPNRPSQFILRWLSSCVWRITIRTSFKAGRRLAAEASGNNSIIRITAKLII